MDRCLARSAALCWGLVVALASLAAAVAVYDLARAFPPKFLDALQVFDSVLRLPGWLSGSAPSFFFSLALALMIGLAAAPRSAGRHCLAWIAIALALEIAQLPALATKVGEWLAATLPSPLWRSTAAYWAAGTFDISDLWAAAAGGALALLIIHRLNKGSPR